MTIPPYIYKLTKPEELRMVMANAKAKGRDDVYSAASDHLSDLEELNKQDPLYQDFYKMLAAYEQLLTEKHLHTTKATRTRQKLTRYSVEKCLEDWALDKKDTQGFTALVENGMIELTGEFIVVKYADRFPTNVVEAAKKRLNIKSKNRLKIDEEVDA